MKQPEMSADAVLRQIHELSVQEGGHLTKRDVKKQHPDILKSALYYFPSWEHAMARADDLT